MGPLVEVSELRTFFPVPGTAAGGGPATVRAVDGISLAISRGEVLGVVGEFGSGKTTLGRTMLRLIEPTSGVVRFDGTDVRSLRRRQLKEFRRRAQIVFQDPFSSLSPRMTIRGIISEPLLAHGLSRGRRARIARVAELLQMVGLPAEYMERYPHELSGGQRQRVAIARSLSLNPEFVVADEPVSALDVSVQAQVLNLLRNLKRQLGLTILFVGHDLAVVEYVADRIAVMYLGKIMEIGPTNALVHRPMHPYTRALLSAAPVPDPSRRRRHRVVLQGDIPSPINPPSGCVFRTRCPNAVPICEKEVPRLVPVGQNHLKACLRDDLAA